MELILLINQSKQNYMARNVLFTLLFLFLSGTVVIGQSTSLSGNISDKDTGEPILFGNVAIYKEGNLVTGVETDFDGNYSFSNMDPGTYNVEATYVGYQPQRITDVVVYAGKSNILNIQIGEDGGIDLIEVEVIAYREPLIEQDNTTQGSIVTSEEIKNLPTRSINGLAATSAGVSSGDDGDALAIRGSRTEGTVYIVDGILTRGNLIPESEIDQLQVITGGVDASYGDVSGGVISITTKGPSSRFGGGIEAETSELFDNYGYNLLRANVSGPILKRQYEDGTETSILGFRFSGQYRLRRDDDPPALPIYVINDESRQELIDNPMKEVVINGLPSIIPSGQELTNDNVDILDYRPNEKEELYNFTAKLDARLSDAIDVTVSGNYSDRSDLFTPGYGSTTPANERGTFSEWRGTWTTLNSHNNPIELDRRYRGNFRFRHKLGKQGVSQNTAEGEDRKASIIQNAAYTLQFGYEKNLYTRQDTRHEDDFFSYGHIGNFDYQWVPTIGESDWSEANIIPFLGPTAHEDYLREFVGYTPGASNPTLTNYNKLFEDTSNDNDFILVNGDYRGEAHEVWNFHDNIGTVYNLYQQRDRDYYTFRATSSFEIVPGGSSNKGRHNIQFGINYEQRFLRGYDIRPNALWILARSQVNRHLSGVDTSNVVGHFFEDFNGFIPSPLDSFALLAPNNFAEDFEGNYFFERVRQIDGTPVEEFFNVDKLNPDQLSLGLFSAQELNDNTSISLNYYGYDYKGEKLGNDVSFDDFFSSTDENGVRDFPIGSFQPIYAAAYIQDKFTFKDVIFRLGLRVDRYDANTKVLKDPYTLYEGMNARDFYALDETSALTKPLTVEDDFVVYINGDSERSTDVAAYRDGEQWYFPNGEAANDGNIIFGSGVVTPRYYANRVNNIRDKDFDINNSFEDFEPKLIWMPRLAFSFPISEDANFFAHYDILVQRPSSGQALTTPLQYLYMEERSNILFQNPNLKPQRTVDYEVGFQQKISNSSALKIAAYYKEMRDMIQRRPYLYVASPISTYTTFDNQDFGTVKGFSLQYDLRRTKNITVNASYTLQFADGTGSDTGSQAGLTSNGNLRTLFPLNFDERHRLNVTLDYRYGNGPKYTGPKILGNDIFANAGINLNGSAVSGRPYSSEIVPDLLGSRGRNSALNGARRPWNYWLNLKIDKQFTFTLNKAEPNTKKRNLGLNVYLRIQNLLDQQNVINVYRFTGSPEDDGYLTSSFGEDAIRQTVESGQLLDSYLASYQWREVNPTFYSLPRRMFLGASFNF